MAETQYRVLKLEIAPSVTADEHEAGWRALSERIEEELEYLYCAGQVGEAISFHVKLVTMTKAEMEENQVID